MWWCRGNDRELVNELRSDRIFARFVISLLHGRRALLTLPKPAMSRLIVKNLPSYTDTKRLREHFERRDGPGGTITDVKVAMKPDGSASRGFGFVGFKTDAEAKVARDWFDRTYVGSTRINVALVDVRVLHFVAAWGLLGSHALGRKGCTRSSSQQASTYRRSYTRPFLIYRSFLPPSQGDSRRCACSQVQEGFRHGRVHEDHEAKDE
jgi:RNA recognition motif-containing protein